MLLPVYIDLYLKKKLYLSILKTIEKCKNILLEFTEINCDKNLIQNSWEFGSNE